MMQTKNKTRGNGGLNKGNKKGIAGGIAAVFVIILVVAVISSLGFQWAFSASVKKEAGVQTTLYTMENSLEAAKSYLEGAMDYSVYQACYVMLKQGGYAELPAERSANGEVFWYDNKAYEIPTEDAFRNGFNALVQGYLNIYTSSDYNYLIDYTIKLPKYTIYTEETDGGFTVKTMDWDKRLLAEKVSEEEKQAIEIEGSPFLQRTYALPCFKLFSAASEKWNSAKGILPAAIDNELKKWPSEYTTNSPYKEPKESEKSGIFYNALHSKLGEASLRQLGITHENALQRVTELIGESIKSAGEAIKQGMQGAPSGAPTIEELRRLTETFYPVDVTNEPTVKINVKTSGDTSSTRYRFAYEISANVKVEVLAGQSLPVFNGRKIGYEPLKLVFHARETRNK